MVSILHRIIWPTASLNVILLTNDTNQVMSLKYILHNIIHKLQK